MKSGNSLADNVKVCRPEPLEPGVRKPGRREIVDQRIEPDVDGLFGIAGEGNAPWLPQPRNRDVLEATLEQPQHFIAPDRGLDAQVAAVDKLEELVGVSAQIKKVISLSRWNQFQSRMLDTAAIDDLAVLLELLATSAVQPLVFGHIQIGGVALLYAAQQLRNGAEVAWLRRPDPVIVAALEPGPEVGETGSHRVDPLLWLHSCFPSRLEHRLAVLVHAHKEVDLISSEAAITRDAVRAHFFQSVPEVRVTI